MNCRRERNARRLEMAGNDIKNYLAIGKFNGESTEDVEKYFRKLERYQVHARYNNEKKLTMLPFGFEGKSLDFYETLSDEVRADYGKIKDLMISHFKSNKSQFLRWEKISKIRKTANQ